MYTFWYINMPNITPWGMPFRGNTTDKAIDPVTKTFFLKIMKFVTNFENVVQEVTPMGLP